MDIGHDIVTPEPMSLNLVAETATMELKESDTVRQEPLFLKIFIETTVQTETSETQEEAVQNEAETTKKQEVAVQIEDEEAKTHVLIVQTQEVTT